MKCTRCKWYKNDKGINCIGFSGNENADLVFVGEAFGKNEAETGEFFVGKTGDLFNNLLMIAKLKRSEIAIINAMRCYQKDNPTPTKKELNACFYNSLIDINSINPKLVIAMGASACYSMLGKQFNSCLDRVIYSEKINKNVYTVYHPSASLYNKSRWQISIDQFKKINEIIYSKSIEPFKPKHFDYTYIDEQSNIRNLIEPLINTNIVYLDIEGTGLDFYKDLVTFLQLGTENKRFIFSRKAISNNINLLNDIIKNKFIIGAGFEFDHKFLMSNFDININYYKWDVILAEYIISGVGDNNLSYLTGKYVPESYGYDDDVKEEGGAHKVFDLDKKLQYASNDIGVLSKIYKKQYKMLSKEKDKLWLYENITLPCNRVLTEMSIKGVRLDLKRIPEVDAIYENKAKKALIHAIKDPGIDKCERHFSRKFNPRSSEMVRWLLIDYYKLPIIKETKKGNPSVGEKEMKKYAKDFNNSYCKIMGKYRSYQHLRNGFLSGVLPKLINGVAHTSYGLHSTTTGRPNSKDPNLLNIPGNQDIKECYITFDGYTFIYSDFSTMEIRVVAALSQDENLIALCNDPTKEFHSAVACQVFNKDYDTFIEELNKENKEYKTMRTEAKSTSFGILYQMSAKSLAKEIGCTEKRAREIIYQYFENFPRLAEYIEELKAEVIANGYLKNYFGFTRYWKYHDIDDKNTLREAVNFPTQSTAFNLTQLAMIAIDKEFKKREMSSFISLQVYDSIISQSIKEEIDATAKIMQYNMENSNKAFKDLCKVNLKCDVDIGQTLGNLEKYM